MGSFIRLSMRSFMEILNKIGPKIDPSGTSNNIDWDML